MLFYTTLFLSLLYFKIFRVRRKQETVGFATRMEGFVTNSVIIALVLFGFLTESWYSMLIVLVLLNIMASLMVTAVQLGIFIDGKPILGISRVFALTPVLSLIVILGSASTVIIQII